jgi:hypothetical protein
LNTLGLETERIKYLGSKAIPDIESPKLLDDPEVQQQIRNSGVAVIRGVVPEQEALQYKEDIREYIKNNSKHANGFPEDHPSVWEIYWSPGQIRARNNLSLLETQKRLLKLWNGNTRSNISIETPLIYADRLRIRPPGDARFALGPHSDGGSVERWEDPEYREVYRAVLDGNWEKYNAFDWTHRLAAKADLYNGAGGCSMFRMFQAWLSMSDTGPGEGTLCVFPNVKVSSAYLMLRPFFEKSKDGAWEFRAPCAEFPGSVFAAAQEYNASTHPHLDLANTMVSMPKVRPGDYVVWHCDSIHAVESQHRGTSDSSVLYIPVVPLCDMNVRYLERQRQCFANGKPPPDFPGGDGERQFTGRATAADFNVAGKLAFGIGDSKFLISTTATVGERAALEYANSVLY